MDSFKELLVYKLAYGQAIWFYDRTKGFPRDELYGLTSQIRRAAVGIPLTIAEGYGKLETGKELIRFLSMARGSSAELEVLLDFCKDFKYMSESEYKEAKAKQQEVGKMLTGLIKSLKAKHGLA